MNKHIYKKIGERIRDERKNTLEYSQEQLAEQLECVRQTISAWENGDRINKITLEQLFALCDILECDIGYLLCEYDTKRHINAGIPEETGLSEQTIENLRFERKMCEDNSIINKNNTPVLQIIIDALVKDSDEINFITKRFLDVYVHNKEILEKGDSWIFKKVVLAVLKNPYYYYFSHDKPLNLLDGQLTAEELKEIKEHIDEYGYPYEIYPEEIAMENALNSYCQFFYKELDEIQREKKAKELKNNYIELIKNPNKYAMEKMNYGSKLVDYIIDEFERSGNISAIKEKCERRRLSEWDKIEKANIKK